MTFYKQLSHDLDRLHVELVNRTIDNFKNEKLLDEKTVDALKATDVKHCISTFYQRSINQTILEEQ